LKSKMHRDDYSIAMKLVFIIAILSQVLMLSCGDRKSDVEYTPEYRPSYCARDSVVADVRNMPNVEEVEQFLLALHTSEEYSCFNYRLHFDVKTVDDIILVSVQDLEQPDICQEAIGPAGGIDTLTLDPGTYMLQVRYCDPKWPEVRYDMYRLQIDTNYGISLNREKVVYQMSVWR